MASIKKRNKVSKKKTVRKKHAVRIRAGKLSTYQNTVALKLKECADFSNLVKDTLTKYGTILGDLGDITGLGEDGNTLVATLAEIDANLNKFEEAFEPIKAEADEFNAAKVMSGMDMHFKSLSLVSMISDLLDAHTRVFGMCLAEINQLSFK